MGNRKEQIADLEREIAQKNQTLNQLKEAELSEDLEENKPKELTPEEKESVEDFINSII
ncbi:hypothetical protein D3C80_1699550 [compost metagenome]